MDANQILEKIRTDSPALLSKIDDKVAARVVRATLAEIGKQLAQVDDGALSVPGLGRFKVKQVEKEKEGEKKIAKRISFRVAKPMDEEKKQKRKAKREKAGKEQAADE
ncbi:hypothetical protein Q8A64_17765 [Oxalobacteraceae bacterium R-40]|uniref:DNA-binding protein HU-beta n=1 Tax=Keguizhuia sedimenti TaxID=3064264 RepID=A0ABU1BUY6_9BURK|nr:hypothetical protein [Oxalobacteraceae bacterium R-40]